MDEAELRFTSWGHPSDKTDARALRRFNALLQKMATLGEIVVAVLALTVVSTFLGFLYLGNFESVIFTDGTNLTCVFDGNRGEITNGK